MNRALGVTAAKRKIAKATGIPTSKQGRRTKVARMSGCLLPTLLLIILPLILLSVIL